MAVSTTATSAYMRPNPRPLAGEVDACDMVDSMTIIHDAENCNIPHDSFANGSEIFDATLREVLEVMHGGRLPANLLTHTLGNKVKWYLVINHDPKNPYHVHEKVLEQLKDRGVDHVSPLNKSGSVDEKVAGLLDREADMISRLDARRRGRHVVVLLGGDRDFARPVRNIRAQGGTVVILHCGEARSSFLDIVKHGNKPMSNGSWHQIVAMCSHNRHGWHPNSRKPGSPKVTAKGAPTTARNSASASASSSSASAHARTPARRGAAMSPSSSPLRQSPPPSRHSPSPPSTSAARGSGASPGKGITFHTICERRKEWSAWDKYVQPAQGLFVGKCLLRKLNNDVTQVHPGLRLTVVDNNETLRITAHPKDDEAALNVPAAFAVVDAAVRQLPYLRFYANAPRNELRSPELLTFASRNKVCLWVMDDGRGPKKPTGLRSSIRIVVPLGWSMDQVLAQAREMAGQDGISIHSVKRPHPLFLEQVRRKHGTFVKWIVMPDLKKHTEEQWDTLMLQLVGMDGVMKDGVKVCFEGASDAAARVGNMTAVVLVTHVDNADALSLVRDRVLARAAGVEHDPDGTGTAAAPAAASARADPAFECFVCMESKPLEEGLLCDGEDSQHFMCKDCLGLAVRSMATSDDRLSQGCDVRCVSEDCCFARQQVVQSLQAEHLEMYIGLLQEIAQHRAIVEERARQTAEAERLAALGAEERAVNRAVHHINDKILTLACPHCGAPVLDWTGCNAVTCAACSRHFCGWCFSKADDDQKAHACAAKCGTKHGAGMFGDISESLRELRQQRLDAFLRTVEPGTVRRRVADACRKNAEDLGLQLKDHA